MEGKLRGGNLDEPRELDICNKLYVDCIAPRVRMGNRKLPSHECWISRDVDDVWGALEDVEI